MAAQLKSESVREGPWLDSEEYRFRKRLPKRMPKRKNDVYVNRKTDFKAQFGRCLKMLEEERQTEIYIHGLGAAVNRAMTLALRLSEHFHGSIGTAVNTSTVELVDDLEPQQDEQEQETQQRNNSAIHIKLYRIEQKKESVDAS